MLGPLDEDALVAAVIYRPRSRQLKLAEPDALRALRAAESLRVDQDCLWHLVTPREPAPRDRRLLDLVPPGTVLTRRQMHEALQQAG